jgi:predicted GTPase
MTDQPQNDASTLNEADLNAALDEAMSQVDPAEIEALKQASAEQRFSLLMVGRTGMGKSSTINRLMGENVAEIGRFDATTLEVTPFESRINDVPYVVYDTPGLCDDLPESGNDLAYLQHIIDTVDYVDCMMFVTRLDETRVSSDEMRGIQLITRAFGDGIWARAIIVFTHADQVDADEYDEYLHERGKRLRKEIARWSPQAIADAVPAVGVDNTREHTPDGRYWLSTLYEAIFRRISRDAKRSLFMLTAHRLVEADDIISGQTSAAVWRAFLGKGHPRVDEPATEPAPIYVTRTFLQELADDVPALRGIINAASRLAEQLRAGLDFIGALFTRLFGGSSERER